MVKKFLIFSLLFFLLLPIQRVEAATLLQKVRVNNLGLVGYWTLDGNDTNWRANTTADKSGNGNTGTMTNMSTTTSPAIGKIGQALKFDGVNTNKK